MTFSEITKIHFFLLFFQMSEQIRKLQVQLIHMGITHCDAASNLVDVGCSAEDIQFLPDFRMYQDMNIQHILIVLFRLAVVTLLRSKPHIYRTFSTSHAGKKHTCGKFSHCVIVD